MDGGTKMSSGRDMTGVKGVDRKQDGLTTTCNIYFMSNL